MDDYHPLDLLKPIAPDFSSQTTLIYPLSPSPAHSLTSHTLTPAPLTLSTHPLTAPTHTPSHKPTIHSSLKELSSSSTQEPCRRTNIDAEWMIDGCSSIHTSGYSTGCSLYYPNTTPLTRSLSETALFRTATIVEADTPEDHARLLQPENETSFEVHGRNSSASDSFRTSPDTTDLGTEIDGNEKLEVPVSVSHDSAAKQTATDSLTAGHTSQLPTVRLSNSTDQERSSPSFSASVTLTGTSSEQVSSSTTVTSCTGSSLVNKIATRPPINNHENGKNATTEKSVIKAQHHPLLLEVAPTDRISEGAAVSPSTAAVSAQLVTEHDKFSLIVRASQAELSRDGIHQHSSSSRSSPTSGSNGSGSLIDYAGYLHIESPP